MAPMTRSNALVPAVDGLQPPPRQQRYREASWQFVESENRSERELSEEPASSYDEDADMAGEMDEEDYYEKQPPLDSPEDHEDILHPLREAANRVGREVERFAEVLDGYNPQRATAQDERHDMMVDIIELYHEIAVETVDRLREQHAGRSRKAGGRWKKKIRGFEVTSDQDEMDIEDSDENLSPPAEKQTTLQDLERWEQEAQTWDLLRRLVPLRFTSPKTEHVVSTQQEIEAIHQFSTEKEVWDNFLHTDGLALERKTVLQWLKDTAEETREDISTLVEDLQKNADRGEITAHGWIHTKAAIKKQKLYNSSQGIHLNSSMTEALVTQLDPDATTRQKRKLEVQDEYFERSTWMGCYELLRRGADPSTIRDWCLERTEVWRAISMSGLPDERDEADNCTTGTSSLWRRMCFALARKGGSDDYERAVYGILSGDISSVEPVCQDWDDLVFVHYNALLRTQFDKFIEQKQPHRSSSPNTLDLGVFDAVQFHGDPETTGKRLISTLQSDSRTAQETKQPMKMIQGVLIANQFAHFITQQGLALSKFANANGVSSLIPPNKKSPENEGVIKYITLDDHDSLRVLTHILLVLRGFGLDLGGIFHETEVENVIVAYISFLRLAGKEELIPLYCSQLSGKRKYAILCRNLIDVTDPEQRATQIKLMRELGLDVQEFVSLQARFLLSDFKDTATEYPATDNFNLLCNVSNAKGSGKNVRRDFFGEDGESTERTDMLLIRSLEWYLLVDGLWSETFTVGTMLYLRFYKHLHLQAARTLAFRLSTSHISLTKTKALLGQTIDFQDLEIADEDLTEVLDGSADQKRLLRTHMAAEAKSYRELEALVECLDQIETLTTWNYMRYEPDEQHGSEWTKFWRNVLASKIPTTKASVQPLLKGWLLTCQNEAAEHEFKHVREAYLPETILAYIVVLQITGESLTRDFLLESMELAAIIADEDSDLLGVFMKTGRMQELVEALALSSKNLLLATAQRSSTSSRSKKMRLKGWRHDLWNVKH